MRRYTGMVRFDLRGGYKPRRYMVSVVAGTHAGAAKKMMTEALELLTRFVPKSKIKGFAVECVLGDL